MFQFDGGKPPWTSGLSQGTALQVLARAWSRFKEPALLTAAQQALGIFQTPPPNGVQVETAAGVGVRRVHLRAERPDPERLHPGASSACTTTRRSRKTRSGSSCSKRATPRRAPRRRTTTRAPGRCYDQYAESNLNYHELLTEFLQHLCERTRKGPPIPATPPPAPAPTTPTSTTPTTSTPRRPRRRAPRRRRRAPRAAPRRRGGLAQSACGGERARRDADRRRSDLLHDRAALHDLREDAAGHRTAEQDAEGRHARGRADVALEGLDRAR